MRPLVLFFPFNFEETDPFKRAQNSQAPLETMYDLFPPGKRFDEWSEQF